MKKQPIYDNFELQTYRKMNKYVLVANSWITLRELLQPYLCKVYSYYLLSLYATYNYIHGTCKSSLDKYMHITNSLNLNKSWVPYVYCMYSHSYSEAIHPLWSRYGVEIMSIHPAFSFKIHNKLVNKASQLNGNSPQQHVTFIEVNEL